MLLRLALFSAALLSATVTFAAAPADKKVDKPSDDPQQAAEANADWVEKLVEKCQPSVVVVTVEGRDGKQDGLGSGFVVSRDGLIATNLHVIGEARPIHVRLTNGKKFPVVSIAATDRALDLALIRIDAHDLPALELGDSDQLRQGQRVVALGNPLGLEHSVVAGVVSGSREINGLPLIQLAIPIEPGNSGGPLVDDRGRVHGLLTMKSAVTQNLGFAVKINALKDLLKQPNPIPMARWLTIGALDPKEWTALFGGLWRQRRGRLTVEGAGAGFGGRSLCLAKRDVPNDSYEIAVTVKLDDEAGAAGLVFASDGRDRHYGFYPSNGKLRLSRFDGPDVLSWNVLYDQPSSHYRPDDWNTLKVRVDANTITCWVNGQQVIESSDVNLRGGQVGLAKFRQTKAEFKQFRLAEQLSDDAPAADVVARIEKSLEKLSPAGVEAKVLDDLAKHAGPSATLIEQRAQQLEAEVKQLRALSVNVHRRHVEQRLVAELALPDDKCNLIKAALLVALLDNPEIDVNAYLEEVDRMGREIQATIPKGADEAAKLKALNHYLFTENGFHGSRGDYDHRANSYLNEVIDDREGLPITLSVLYMELGRRVGLNIVGLGTPGHFLVRHVPKQGEPIVVDPFEGGELLDRAALDKRLKDLAGREATDRDLVGISKRAIIERMIRNLLGNANREEKQADMLAYLDALIAIAPDAVQERLMRAVLHYQAGTPKLGLADTEWLLKNEPEGVDLERVLELQQALERAELRRSEAK
ncbi:MAG: trypsin-like peptidase domain-containing protein [Planctomycetaceae bacterium]|nr:trypsin-like peptidase domain-containing protein [Planctomycetaceae bacterium]